jgi:hypothetical protein
VEPQFAEKLDSPFKSVLQELRYPIPPGYALRVSLREANGKKKHSNSAADSWSPASGRLEIWFEPSRSSQNEVVEEAVGKLDTLAVSGAGMRNSSAQISRPRTFVHPAETDLVKILDREEADLLRALDRAESKPGWTFVPLKKFRDEILPSEHIPSMSSDVEQRRVLESAIEKRLILIGRVLNPKAPQFPVTTIRVNRMMPEVKAILGGGEADLDFHPVEIKGEPLSDTVIRERHR